MNLLWRDTGRTVRFLGVDGRVAFGFVLVLLHISLWTLGLSILLVVAFGLLERFDYTLPNAARKLRVMIGGRVKRSKMDIHKRPYRSS